MIDTQNKPLQIQQTNLIAIKKKKTNQKTNKFDRYISISIHICNFFNDIKGTKFSNGN
jgi:hypothetical protein